MGICGQVMLAAVFLDRDGVINRSIVRDGKPYPPGSLDELEILPGVEEALSGLKAAGFCLIVVTNQPDVARGTVPRALVDAMNNRLETLLPLEAIITCFHDSADDCDCRKPKPGMLLAAARDWDIDLSISYMIGDRWRDIEAGARAGCTTIFIDYGYDEQQPETWDFRTGSLLEAAEIILQKMEVK
jgi:D-glycero-D-manno-heptose 1,7-bisphosphate phosphatase